MLLRVAGWAQGPQAAQLLGDLGADVIKVELPELGDQGRWIPISLQDLRAPFFVGCNRDKRSITLDLRHEAGKEVLFKLVDTADPSIPVVDKELTYGLDDMHTWWKVLKSATAAFAPCPDGLELCGNQPLVWGVPTKLQNSLSRSNRSRFG